MRQLCFALAFLGWPALVVAQSPATATTGGPASPAALPLPHIGLPLAPIGLPLPPIGLQPTIQKPTRRAAGTDQPGGRRDHDNAHHRRQFGPAPSVVYYGFPTIVASESTQTPGSVALSAPPVVALPVTGQLRLEVEPAHLLQVFVDGEYVGMPDDFGGEFELEPGARRLEIRAPGYETAKFDVRVNARQAITYRGALTPAAASPSTATPAEAPAEPAAPRRRQTFYFIPGCYLGNIPPEDVQLPPGCDLSRLITRTP